MAETKTPWHLMDKLKDGERYRCQNGGSLVFYRVVGQFVTTSDGTYNQSYFLDHILDPEQFHE
jgi:hypothetical protein